MAKKEFPVDQYVSAAEAADIIGVQTARIRQMAIAGEIISRKMGHQWIVLRADAKRIAREIPPTGRPRGGGSKNRNGRH